MSNINQRLNGLNPLSYIGVDAVQPTDFITKDRDPTVNDSRNFYLGTWWLNTTTLGLWYLAALSGHIATWIMIGGAAGTILTLTGNVGGAVGPTAGNINVVGDAVTILVTGNPGTSTLTISTAGPIATSYNTQAGVAVPAGGVLNIIGANGIVTSGAGNTVTVTNTGAVAESFITNPATGAAVPAAGVLTFAGNTNMVFSAAGSTVSLALGGMTVMGGTVVYDGTDLISIATGNTGQILTSNGAGINPSYQTLPGSTTCAFSAYNNADVVNQTGNGANAFVTFDTEVYDMGNNYDNATFTFTAPTSGTYQFNTVVACTNVGAAMDTGLIALVIGGTGPSTGIWSLWRTAAYAILSGGAPGVWRVNGSLSTFLAAGDTVQVRLVISGGPGNTVTIAGSGINSSTWFSGYRVA